MPLPLKKRIIVNILLFGSVRIAAAYTPTSDIAETLAELRTYGELTYAAGSMNIDTYASNLTTWQMPHGGWCKAYASKYLNPWDGSAARSSWTNSGTELGTFDNNATIQEMRLLAERYKATSDDTLTKKFKDSFTKGIGFILTSQYSSGGWPQVYPKRGNYSDHVTYNDNVMVRVMVMVRDIIDETPPFDTDIISSDDRTKLSEALDEAIAFTLNAQIIDNDVPTVWCAQHDSSSYAPRPARSYELESKSGSESVAIVYFLMNWPDQSDAIQNAVESAFAWFKKTRVTDLIFNGRTGEFETQEGASLWYRFYDLVGDKGFFCDRDGIKTYDITTVSEERRTHYSWGGDYASKLLSLESEYLAALETGVVHSSHASKDNKTRFMVYNHADHVGLSFGKEGTYRVTLLNARGAMISSRVTSSTSCVFALPLPSGCADSGVYILCITSVDGTVMVTQPLVRF